MRIGIIGAGMIGSTLAELWTAAGHDVRLASGIPTSCGRSSIASARTHRLEHPSMRPRSATW